LRATHGVVLVDSLGTWVANALHFAVDTTALLDALQARTDPTVIVTEEVGLAIHAATPVGRLFTDRLGELNTAVAAIADSVLFAVAGRVLRLEPADPVIETG
jgi:adenosyl cobinamide kinase/adenosyl cobinamide phosphate guanylyltransferase